MSEDTQVNAVLPDVVKRALAWFFVLTAVLSLSAAMLVIEMGLKRHYVAIMMWTPAIATFLTCRIMRLDIASLGWKWGEGKWQLYSFLTPITYGLVAYSIIWGFSLGGFPNPEFVEEAGYHLGLVGWSDTAIIIFGVLVFSAVGMIWHMGTALGEEIGWRGFLTPHLLRITNFPIASLITGLVWAVWQAPIIFYTKYNAGPVGLELQFVNFSLMTVGISFIMTYYRLKSGSLWTATVIHAAHNAYILTILQPLTTQYEDTWRYANEFGFVLPLVVCVFAVYFWYRARKEGLEGT